MASPTLSTEQVETTLTMPDAELFLEIDGLQLNERLLRWKEARRNAPGGFAPGGSNWPWSPGKRPRGRILRYAERRCSPRSSPPCR